MAASTLPAVVPRHIQDMNAANTTKVWHWGYGYRVMPCTNDAGSCEYLDAVYWMHDVSMLYTFILWGVLLGIAVVWVTIRGWRFGGPSQRIGCMVDVLLNALSRTRRRLLLPDAPLRSVFGRVTRLQVLILTIMLGYLLVFSQVGIAYKTWITPVKNHPELYNTRVGMGGWSDRIGALAYALTPFTIVLSSRESILSILTGIPYQHFNFLHRWLGRVIFIQSFLHTLVWTIIEARLYQPQPAVYTSFINQTYIVYGIIAMTMITFLTIFSTERVIAWTGYEFFRITHLLIAVLYVGMCWGHWKLLQCWMIPSLVLILGDQAVRYLRMLAIHVGGGKGRGIGFRSAQAQVKVIGDGDDAAIRIDFDYEHAAWKPGQHFFLCFPSLSIWQSHPFTPASLPDLSGRSQHHTYIIREQSGLTSKLRNITGAESLPVILTGPYGTGFPNFEARNLLVVSGGTGVTFTLPIALAALKQQMVFPTIVDFVWIVRQAEGLNWISAELGMLKKMVKQAPNLRINIFVTREGASREDPASQLTVTECEKADSSSSSSSDSESEDNSLSHPYFRIEYLVDRHPDMSGIVASFLCRTMQFGGAVEIVGSGPEPMGSDLRTAVAAIKTSEDVSLYWDSRE